MHQSGTKLDLPWIREPSSGFSWLTILSASLAVSYRDKLPTDVLDGDLLQVLRYSPERLHRLSNPRLGWQGEGTAPLTPLMRA